MVDTKSPSCAARGGMDRCGVQTENDRPNISTIARFIIQKMCIVGRFGDKLLFVQSWTPNPEFANERKQVQRDGMGSWGGCHPFAHETTRTSKLRKLCQVFATYTKHSP